MNFYSPNYSTYSAHLIPTRSIYIMGRVQIVSRIMQQSHNFSRLSGDKQGTKI